jgi:predicted DCC family thiol-disulfide oxidoreductase YuxK
MSERSLEKTAPLVVVVDGDCALCIGLVEWLGRRIPAAAGTPGGREPQVSPETVVFLPGQSALGGEVLRRASVTDFDSVLVLHNGLALSESRAVLALATILPRRYRALAALARIVPRRLADAVYQAVSKRRIRIWGRAEVCAIDSAVAGATFGPRGLLGESDARRLVTLAGALSQ